MDAAYEANLYSAYERRVQEAARPRPVLPVTIITGFLGAGKTTLLRKILRSKHNLRIAAVVNEYGSVDHDGGMVERDGLTDNVDKLAGGCVCCQGSLGDQLEEKVADLLRRPDHADDRFDYLVVETSGVSDPESMIQSFDKTFGKLTRARLDSVVAVVDSDFLMGKMNDGEGLPVALKRQLQQADVVVLNKADLLQPAGLSELSCEVSKINAEARVTSCSFGHVALHEVLDVEAPRLDIQGVSHERVAPHLYVSPTGGNLRKPPAPSRARVASRASSVAEGKGHLQEDGLEQVTFTSKLPLSLTRFQDWVSCGMPSGAVRAKGVLAFDEDRITRSVFNMSGRRRLSFELDGVWEGPIRLHLVVIGVAIEKQKLLADLESLCVEPSTPGAVRSRDAAGLSQPSPSRQDLDVELSRVTELLKTDMLFDHVPADNEPICPPHVVRFRFTGRGAYGIPPSQLSVKFGVNLNAVNRAILRAVNSGTAMQRLTAKRHVGTPVDKTSTDTSTGTDDRGSGEASVVKFREAAENPKSPVENVEAATEAGATAAGTEAGAGHTGNDGASGPAAPRIFLTCQEGVRVREERGTNEDDCVVLRYAVGGKVLLSETWPIVVEETRRVMAHELGHVHFCSCFS